MQRSGSELRPPALPPSPIPTGKGSRSAANDTFIQYLHRSLRVPDLALPGPSGDVVPSVVDFGSLVSGDRESLDGVVSSAREFGAFLITGHGISRDELHSLIRELEDHGDVHDINGEDFWTWLLLSSPEEGVKLLPEAGDQVGSRPGLIEPSEKLVNVARKLERMTRQLGRVLVENAGSTEQCGLRIQGEQLPLLTLFRYNGSISLESSQRDYMSLCLYLPTSPSQLLIPTALGLFSFDAGPATILVALGKRFQELSQESFRGVAGEVMCEPQVPASQVAYSLELKWFSLDFDIDNYKSCKTISVRDQILVVVSIAVVYKIICFLIYS